MATTLLKRTAAIWVPPRSVGERALAAEPSLVAMLPAPESSGGVRWARVSLEALPAMKSAALVFDARDVTLMPVKLPPDTSKQLVCPMPGLVVSIDVAERQEVKEGEKLAVVEAMKMENILRAERDGTVVKIHAAPGANLAVDAIIMEFE